MKSEQNNSSGVVVVGAGIAGIRTALDLAESGIQVHLVDRSATIGGTLLQLDKWFPDNHCGMCKILPIFARDNTSQYCIRRGLVHPNIELLPSTQVQKVEGEAGNFTVTIKSAPQGVRQDLCIGCGLCAEVCPIDVPNEFDQGLTNRKAIYPCSPFSQSSGYVIDSNACNLCQSCVASCPTKAIDLSAQDQETELTANAIILSTGFEEFDPILASQWGYRRFPNVVTSIELERLLSPGGPTAGQLVRPSNQQLPKSLAFLQCVGSRDVKRNYCSAACCMYALKEAILIKQAHPEIDIEIFYMDLRAFGKGYYRYQRTAEELGIRLTRCRVPVVKQDFKTQDLLLPTMTEANEIAMQRFEMVVLSVGQTPSLEFAKLGESLGLSLNEWGYCYSPEFSSGHTSREGIYVCGSASGPKDIVDTIIEAGAAANNASLLVSGDTTKDISSDFGEDPALPEEEPRTALFLCTCGDQLTSAIDMEYLTETGKHMPSIVHVEQLPFLCQQETLQGIKDKAASSGADRIVLGACSPFNSKKLFSAIGMNPSMMQSLSLREDVAWAHANDKLAATQKAKALTAMAVEKVRLRRSTGISEIGIKQEALVIGGGLAGIVSALSIAEHGFEVHLVERGTELGGHATHIYTTLQGNDVQVLLKDVLQKVESNPRIHVYKETEVVAANGFVGNFEITFSNKDENLSPLEVGAIVVATGGEVFQPTEYLYGENENVITQEEFEKKLVAGDLGEVKSVAMIQCVGSREDERPYCSRICCSQALKNALRLKDLNPEAEVVILYRDVMSYGFMEQYYTQAREKGVLFLRYDQKNKPKVKAEGGKLRIEAQELMLGGTMHLEPDVLVLSTAILPREEQKLADLLQIEFNEDGFFKEAEIKFRPVDFLRDGIFVCGLAHSPRSIGETLSQARAAAQRASSILGRQKLWSGRMVSEVNARRCVGCEICVGVCPYNARVKDEETNTVIVREALCQSCGACAVACPSGAAKMQDFSDEQVFAMMDVAI